MTSTDAAGSTTRPRLRPDVFWVPLEDGGLYACSSRGRFSLPGGDIARWVERLSPFLDGKHTLEELTRSLGPERRDKVIDLIRLLHRNGLVEDLAQDEPHHLNELEQRIYADQLRYLGELADGAARRFERYRAMAMAVVGSGPALAALAEAALQSGPRQVTVAVVDGAHGDGVTERLEAIARRARKRDSAQSTQLARLAWHGRAHEDEDREGEVRRLLRPVDLVLAVSSDPTWLQLLDRVCAEEGKRFYPALLPDDEPGDQHGEAIIGPASTPGAPGSRWEAAWWRLDPRPRAGGEGSDRLTRSGPGPAVGPAPRAAPSALVAGSLVMCCFRHACGLDPDAERTVTRIDLQRWSTSVHRFLPHPLAAPAAARGADELRAQIARLEAGEEIDEQVFSRAAAACVDARAGILRSIEQQGFQQIPLWVTEVRVADPDGLLAARGFSPVVHGSALEFASSRYRAARLGLELHASVLLDRRRLVHPAGAGSPGAAPDDGWLWGWRLDLGVAELVPVASVFGDRAAGRPLPVGVASGATWAAAVEAGLFRYGQAIAVADALASRGPFPVVDLENAPLDQLGRRLLHILRLAGACISARDITGDLGLPSYAFYLGDLPVAYAAGWSEAGALANGLEQALLLQQSTTAGQPEYAPSPVPPLPGPRGEDAPPAVRPATGRVKRAADLTARLVRRGLAPVAVPLDHDPALAAILPYLVRVVPAAPEQ